jgi:hypothetical protein
MAQDERTVYIYESKDQSRVIKRFSRNLQAPYECEPSELDQQFQQSRHDLDMRYEHVPSESLTPLVFPDSVQDNVKLG